MLSKGIDPKKIETKSNKKFQFHADPAADQMIKSDIKKNGSTQTGLDFWFSDK